MSKSGEQTTEPVLVERRGMVATVTLNDPPHNPIGMAMVDRLEQLFPELGADASVRAIVLTAAGDRSFSVGANITEFGKAIETMTLKGMIDQRLGMIDVVENLPKPVVCAIRGACVGGGLELALGCHFRIAAKGARIGLPEIDLGILPGWGGTQRLTRTVGRAHALDIMLRAKKIGAEEALAIGVVNEICEPAELLDSAHRLAEELADRPPLAVAGILEAVVKGGPLPLDQGLAIEFQALERTSGSEDAREGVVAFFEKRKPNFKGR